MRVGIFFQADDTELVEGLLQDLRTQGLSGSAYKLGRTWESIDGEELLFNFSGITHIVVVPRPESLHSRWFAFMSGYALGGMRNLSFLIRPGLPARPPYVKAANEFFNNKQLIEYLTDEQQIFQKTFEIERSREQLIALGIGINDENLAQRASIGDYDAVEHFLHIGYSADTPDQNGVPLICLAARNNHKKVVELLVSRGAEVNVLSKDRGNSPLMEFAVKGDEVSVRKLLEAGADPNLISKSQQTAIMMAVGEDHRGVVRTLLEYQARIDLKDSLGMSAKKYAEIFKHDEIMAMLQEAEQKMLSSSQA